MVARCLLLGCVCAFSFYGLSIPRAHRSLIFLQFECVLVCLYNGWREGLLKELVRLIALTIAQSHDYSFYVAFAL